MPSVNDVVKEAILRYPEQFPNRYAVLYHIFFTVSGGGFQWTENGDIKYESVRNFNPKNWTKYDFITAILPPPLPGTEYLAEIVDNEDLREMLPDLFAEADEIENIVNNVNTNMFDMTPTVEFQHLQFDKHLIMNVPENVQPDWLEAVNQMKPIAETNGWVFSK